MGPEVRQHLEGLRPAQLEQLEAAFAEVDEALGRNRAQKQGKGGIGGQKKETITTNIDPQGVKGGGVGGQRSK